MGALVELLTDAWWVFPLLAALIVVDSVLPVLPSETALITVGILASRGGPDLLLLMACGTVAAVAGDSAAYALGRGPGGALRDRLLRKDRARRRMERARDELGERPWLVTVARFVPGGRTAAALASGSLGMRYSRFLRYAAVGGALWAPFNILLGDVGGRLFQGSFIASLGASIVAAALLAGAAEHLHRRHGGG